MKNILLVCNAGMSTSVVVEKMKKEAEAQNLDVNIRAVSDAEVSQVKNETDVVLLGPQIGFMQEEIKKKLAENTPVSVIGFIDYGRSNGKAILEQALDLLENDKNE